MRCLNREISKAERVYKLRLDKEKKDKALENCRKFYSGLQI